MPHPDETSPTLLLRLRDPHDNEAWHEFARAYSPLIYAYSRRVGLQYDDAVTVSQDVLSTVAKSVGEFCYDPSKGRFRSWLKTVVRSRVADFLQRESRHTKGTGDTGVQLAIEAVTQANNDDAIWSLEYQRAAFAWASERIKGEFQEKTWDAFWATSVKNEPTKDVAAKLQLSVGAVYVARSRVIARLRKVVTEFDTVTQRSVTAE